MALAALLSHRADISNEQFMRNPDSITEIISVQVVVSSDVRCRVSPVSVKGDPESLPASSDVTRYRLLAASDEALTDSELGLTGSNSLSVVNVRDRSGTVIWSGPFRFVHLVRHPDRQIAILED